MKKYIKILSGRPKDGDIIECIRPVIVLPMFMMAFILMCWSIKSKYLGFGLMSMLFSWQIGWGMSIERFKKSDEKEDV